MPPGAISMINVTLPWPSQDLSPNQRVHWATKSKAAKSYRRTAIYSTMLQFTHLDDRAAISEAPFLYVSIRFVPPDKRHRDLDNLIASMKSGLDGIADGLSVNDRKFRLSAQIDEPAKNPCVRFTIETDTEFANRRAEG